MNNLDLLIGETKYTNKTLKTNEVELGVLLSQKYETFEEQRIVNENHINNIFNEMKDEYLKTGNIQLYSEPVILIYKVKYYIVDGQHRMRVFERLYNELIKPKKDKVSICVKYQTIQTEEELRTAFRKTNYQLEQNENVINSILKNSALPTNSEIYKNKVSNFVNSIPKNEDMIKTKTTNPRPPHLTTAIISHKLIRMEDELGEKDIDFSKVWEKTNIYLKELGINKTTKITPKQWEKCEKFNFYIGAFPKWDEEFLRIAKKEKRAGIPKGIKNKTWENEFGDDGNGNCFVCDSKMTKNKFECGHIISDALGGKMEVENMKPICFDCNRGMGPRNLIEYKEQYYS